MKVTCVAGDKLRSDLTLAGRNLSIMRSSTESVTAPWLIREMAPRIASTLNYFLLHLTGAYCIPSAHLSLQMVTTTLPASASLSSQRLASYEGCKCWRGLCRCLDHPCASPSFTPATESPFRHAGIVPRAFPWE